MKKVLLSEIYTTKVKTVLAETPISDVLGEMASLSISCIVVVDTERRPIGILTERDVVRLLAQHHVLLTLKMADVMSSPVYTSVADIDFREAYRLLQQHGFRHLIVIDEVGRLQGIVTEGDFFLRLDVGDLSELKNTEKIMSRNIMTVDIDAPLLDAINLMSRHRYSCVVVTQLDIPYGIITERDIVRLSQKFSDYRNLPVRRVAHTPLITAPPAMLLPDAMRLMESNRIRHLVIADQGVLYGLVTRHDLVKTLQGGYVDYLQDTIQEQQQVLFKLGQQRNLFKLHDAALSVSANAIFIADRQTVIQWANPAFSKLSGYALEEIIGRYIQDLVKSGEQNVEFYKKLWQTLLVGQVWHGEIINRRKNGDRYPEEMTITPVYLESDEITHFIAIKQDISERKRVEEQIHYLASYDTLTKLPNRRLLKDRIEQAMTASRRTGLYGALLFLDLDNFKPVNDRHGHEVGDMLLQETAHRLCCCVRQTDTVARFGGDEFIVLLNELDEDKTASAKQVAVIAEKIRLCLAGVYKLNIARNQNVSTTVEHHCSSSIGIVLFIEHEVTASEIIKLADVAMYQAKAAGRNMVRFHSDSVPV
jgi:diguanylate cyclase (GGDEF)-like protein/PAS domain S-box-containing protein